MIFIPFLFLRLIELTYIVEINITIKTSALFMDQLKLYF